MMTKENEPTFSLSSIKISTATPGWSLDAWKYIPEGEGPHAVIVMAHGISANKKMGLAPFAETFASAGYACVVFDYRRWGDSDGSPRDCVKITEQLEDYRTVLEWVQKEGSEFDTQRVVLWGTSFSGGHTITLAAEEKLKVACAIAMCAYVGTAAKLPLGAKLRLGAYGLADLIRQAIGFSPLYIPGCAAPGKLGALTSPDAVDGMAIFSGDKKTYPNRISASSLFELPRYNPAATASSITCPLLLVVAEQDAICMPAASYSVAKASEKVTLTKIPVGHFGMYPGGSGYEKALAAELEFLRKHVGP